MNGILVLFDIDGTLLDGAGEGKRAFYATLERMFPGSVFPQVDMAGRTDFGIWTELTAAAGLAELPPFHIFGAEYAPVMAEYLVQRPPLALSGAIGLCRRLATHPGFYNGLVTGNFFVGTRVKLQALGIWDLFAPGGEEPIGGYGDHHPDKGPLAREALDAWNHRFPDRPTRAVVVGDTPEDVRCAKLAGIACLGVATGRFTGAELLECGAEAVVQDLSDTDAIVTLLERISV